MSSDITLSLEDINKNCKILIVDDSEYSRKMIVKTLESEGIVVSGEASSASEAMDLIGKLGANIIITDVVMPDLNGIELCRKFNSAFSERFFIMVTSLNQEKTVIDAITAGAIDFIEKPFDNNQLFQAVLKASQRVLESVG